MKKRLYRLIPIVMVLTFILSAVTAKPVSAQTTKITYTVLEGDTLDSIALAFHTTPYRIRYINYISDADYLYPGEKLIIPGFQDVNGEAIRVKLPYGVSLASYFSSLQQDLGLLNRLNFITNPDQAYAGQSLYILSTDQPTLKEVRVAGSLTSLELAVRQDVSNWTLAEYNDLTGPWDLLPNTSLWLPDNSAIVGVESDPIPELSVKPSTLVQGKTSEWIAFAPPEGAALTGSLNLMVNDSLGQSSGYTPATFTLHFFPTEDGKVTALQGVHRFTKPGMASFILTTTYEDGATFSMQQNILVKNQDYGSDIPLEVEPEFIDPATTVPEWELIKSYVQEAPAEKEWTYGFDSPSPTPDTWISSYGRVRSYNDSDFIYFHSGIDFPGTYATPIYAAAAGEVVYVGDLEVRGGATIISHGRGVYTAYWHQSKINVQIGDHVEAGQTIGMVGDKGRVTGAHLHFEVFVGGVQVDPTEWLQGQY